ncbi:hypothetical protein FOZ60_011739 [Perkinsus olseni]|uniref:PHD-type domain-containing protein n=1 Tax=Perkinsus olseni TaxID=32597 RepID=A0A7J6NCZ7_PEROL|nr:hypothetical protein FOZ60_011739 [Perkinsus olseni]
MVFLRRGDTVKIKGLERKPQFNGIIGEVLDVYWGPGSPMTLRDRVVMPQVNEQERSARIVISRSGRRSEIAVRLRNLKLIEERPPPSFASNGIRYDSIYEGEIGWKVKLTATDKWLMVPEKHLEVLDVSDENGRRRLMKEWQYPSQNPEDPRWLIDKMVARQLGTTRIIGKVMKWHDYHIGASVRYEDGDYEFLPLGKAKSMVIDDLSPEELETTPILPPPPSPEQTSPPILKRRRIISPTEYDSSSPSLDLMAETRLESLSPLTASDPHRLGLARIPPTSVCQSSPSHLSYEDRSSEYTPSDVSSPTRRASSTSRTPPSTSSCKKPIIFFNPIFVEHEGGGQDKGGKWLEEIVKKLRRRRVARASHRTLSKACEWVSDASREVTLDEIAATGVHSEDYLRDLQAIDQHINSGRVLKQRVLADEAPVALVLARPACHHVPFYLGIEGDDTGDSPAKSSDSTESVKCCQCKKGDNERCLLVCDNPDCGHGWHSFCLPYPLGHDVLFMKDFRDRKWFCPECLGTEGRISSAEADACRLLITVCQGRAKESPSPPSCTDSPEAKALKKLPIGNEISLGFCFINAVAFAVKELLNSLPGDKRIMILDVDVHHGNGNETAFYDDPRVLTFSIHRYGPDRTGDYVMPGTGWHEDLGDEAVPESVGMNLNFEMHEGDGDREYVDVITRIVRPVVEQWRPDMMVLLCGFDAIDHSSAAMSFTGPGMDCKLSPEWFGWVYPYLASIVPSGRMVCCTEGGYNPESTGQAGWLLVGSIVEHLAAIERDRPRAVAAAIERRPDVLPISDFARQREWETRLSEHINKFRSVGWHIPV